MSTTKTSRKAAATLAAALALLGGSVVAGHPAAAAQPTKVPDPGTTVTLLSGDRVTVGDGAGGAVGVRPAEGREKVRFSIRRTAGEVYVVPEDARPLLRSGRLDERLFGVRGLIRAGYHDAARDTLPLIVRLSAGRGAAAATGARVTRDLPAVRGSAATVQKGQLDFWSALTGRSAKAASGVDKVWLDGKRELLLDRSVPRIGAPDAWQAGYTGKGVTVAVLDSGVDATHPDLAGKVAESRNFSESPDPEDAYGHGTHVASTIAGSGAASGGRYKGVAPDATLLSGKVCETTFCSDSAMLAGMQWAAAEKRATVVNFSIGGFDTPDLDPLEEAVNTLTAQYGTLFVAAAGNRGCSQPVSSPASADAALAVGAVDLNDSLADFSSCGPRTGDEGVKPDITAPGVDIVAARASRARIGEPVDDHYLRLSGTSMATPHVTGAVALLAQQHPDWTAGQLKAALTASAKPNPALSAYQQGAGRVDVGRAITQAVTTDPVGVTFGKTLWPHQDDEPIAKTVTYHNNGPDDVTLNLSVRAVGPGGQPASAGLFTPSATTVTVPAGGQARVTVTADTRVPGADGLYSGHLLATSGTTQVVTALGVHKEVEMYELTVANIDATGAPTSEYFMVVYGLDNTNEPVPYDPDGTVTLRLPRGQYGTFSEIHTGTGTALLLRPFVNLTADTTVTFDARQARPVTVTAPDPGARSMTAAIRFDQTMPDRPYGDANYEILGDSFAEMSTAYLGEPVPADRMRTSVSSQWAKPDANGRPHGTPYLYVLVDELPGTFPTGYSHVYRTGELATVRQDFSRRSDSQEVLRDVVLYNGPYLYFQDVPAHVVEYYSGDARVMWTGVEYGAERFFRSAPARYQPGRTYRDEWNTGPFGPSLPGSYDERDWVSRTGDAVWVNPPVFGDRGGHAGYARVTDGRMALYRDGALVGETGWRPQSEFAVPATEGTYRLEVSAAHDASDLTTRVDLAWTFRSGHVDGEVPAKLPIQVVRFAPALDADDAAPGGRRFVIPVTVQRQPGAPAAGVKRLTVQVSYDDGATWRAAQVRKTGSGWIAIVDHPRGGGFASLRATATDSAGNTVEQTVVHAYRLSK